MLTSKPPRDSGLFVGLLHLRVLLLSLSTRLLPPLTGSSADTELAWLSTVWTFVPFTPAITIRTHYLRESSDLCMTVTGGQTLGMHAFSSWAGLIVGSQLQKPQLLRARDNVKKDHSTTTNSLLPQKKKNY